MDLTQEKKKVLLIAIEHMLKSIKEDNENHVETDFLTCALEIHNDLYIELLEGGK